MTKRDENKQFNRSVILDAARRIFSEEGFAKANTTQIIEISGFSTGTFYNYFQTKDELMEVLSTTFLKKLRHTLVVTAETIDKDNIDAFIESLSQAVEQLLLENPEDIKLITRNQTYFRDLLLNHSKWQKLVSGITYFIEDLISIKEEAAITSQIILGAFVVMFAYKNNHPDVEVSTITNFMKKYLRSAFKGFTD